MGVRIIQQSITASNNFNKTAPTGASVADKDMERFPAEAAGGKFDFENSDPLQLVSIELKLGGQSAWSVEKEDSDGDLIELFSGTIETEFVAMQKDLGLLTEGESILVSTTGAVGALKCRVAARRVE